MSSDCVLFLVFLVSFHLHTYCSYTSFKKTHNFVFNTIHRFLMDSRIKLISQLYQVLFVNGFLFIIFFCSNLSISPIDTLIRLKNSSSISFLNLISLSLNCLFFKSLIFLSNSKRLCLSFRILFHFEHCLSIPYQYVRFYSLVLVSQMIHL